MNLVANQLTGTFLIDVDKEWSNSSEKYLVLTTTKTN